MSLLLALTASGGTPSGVISWTEQNDVLAAAVKVLVTTSLSCTESNDVVSISGSVVTATPVSIVAAWTEQNDVYALSGTSSAVATPSKIGGDDVPRVEVWEKRKSKKHDEQLDKLIRDAYDKITGKTPAEIKEILAEEETPEIVQAIPVYDDEDDEEILLLLVL